MDSNLKEVLIELQQQNYNLGKDMTELVMSLNQLFKEVHTLKETPERADNLASILDEKNRQAIEVHKRFSEACAANIRRIDPDLVL